MIAKEGKILAEAGS